MGKIGFLFSGQGAQYVGMGKELSESIEVCRDAFESADKELGFSISNICFNGPEEELNKTENTQPAIVTMSIAAVRALEDRGIKADMTAGLSLGEYSALVCSGALTLEAAVVLVKKRGKYMQEAVPMGVGAMAAIIGLDSEKIKEVCQESAYAGIIEAANYNCPGQIVIAGENEAVKVACEKAKEKGALKAIMLVVSGPFHTSMLKSAAQKLEKELEHISFSKFNIPVLTNVTGGFIESTDKIKEYLKQQVMSSVQWEATIRNMMEQGVDTFIEIGPGKVLSGFVKKINRKAVILNVEDLASLNKTIETLKSK